MARCPDHPHPDPDLEPSEGEPSHLHYPAYVVPLDVLFSLDAWVPHQTLLSRGQLVEVVPGLTDFVFVSHQWRGKDHPDKGCQQLRVLQAALKGLQAGRCKVRLDFVARMAILANSRAWGDKEGKAMARHWERGLTQTYVWLDYLCVPQPSVVEASEEKEKVVAQMWQAVGSIVGYVSMASCFLVLAPPLMREEPPWQPINYGSWQRRGWCLMERTSWALSKPDWSGAMLLVEGGELVTLQRSDTVLAATLGTADWTDRSDLERLAPVLQRLLRQKRRHCHELDARRSLLLAEMRCMRHMPDESLATASVGSSWGSGLQAFLAHCGFASVRDCDAQGRTPLHLAAGLGEADMVQALLHAAASATAKTKRVDRGTTMPSGATALHFAAAWCEGPQGERTVDLLLAARCSVDPKSRSSPPPIAAAVSFNNVEMALILLQRRADAESSRMAGINAVGIAAVRSSSEVLEMLLARRASLEQGRFFGTRRPVVAVCHLAACCNSTSSVLPTLLAARADVNELSNAPDGLHSAFMHFGLLLLRLCRRSPRVRLFLSTFLSDEVTPLMCAAVIGNVQAVQALLLARASPTCVSRRGLTAMEMAELAQASGTPLGPTIQVLLQEVPRDTCAASPQEGQQLCSAVSV